MIQRDYAQGRPGAENVREEFLGSLQHAFALAANDDALPLNLDFIYGSVDINGPARFLPLDGQQRLTTLFLLHWYLAWRDGCQSEFRQVFCEGVGSRFSYSVRPSSAEFFDELVNFWPAREAANGASLTGLITNQAWYFRYWRLDPTIQSCLTMREAIHQRFAETRKISGQTFTVADYFARRMDNRWADFFWAYRDKETHLYHDAIMNFFHAVAFICRDPESSGYLEEITTFRGKPLKSTYALYHKGGWLESEFSATLMLLLEIWSVKDNPFTPLLPDNPYFNEATIFKRLVSDPASLAYTDLVQLFAYVAFLRAASEKAEPRALLEWMRVIYNLSINSSYERLGYFASNVKSTTGFYLQQVS